MKGLAPWTGVVLILAWGLILGGCGNEGSLPEVSFSTREGFVSGERPDTEPARTLTVAVAGVVSPERTLLEYQTLIEYLEEGLNRPVRLVQKPSYAEINEMVRTGQADLAFVCTLAYVEGHEKFGMRMLLQPIVNGENRYRSLIIVPKNSGIVRIDDLKGKVFAYADPLSFSGHLAMRYLLSQEGYDPDAFFDRTMFTYSHDNSVRAVADGLVDGAAVDSLVYEGMRETDPTLENRLRVVAASEYVGNPPLVAPAGLDAHLREKILSLFLEMPETAKGRQVLSKMRVDRWTPGRDESLDPVRRIRDALEEGT